MLLFQKFKPNEVNFVFTKIHICNILSKHSRLLLDSINKYFLYNVCTIVNITNTILVKYVTYAIFYMNKTIQGYELQNGVDAMS